MLKNVKGEKFWAFLTSSLLQNIINIDGGTFGDSKKFSQEKFHNAKKI